MLNDVLFMLNDAGWPYA